MGELLKKINEFPKEQNSKKKDDKWKFELCYVWIKEDDTKLIKEQGFNFSFKYLFQWEYCSQERKAIRIQIRENENYIDNFFSENITNISAIVGKNGVGKSTILNHLNYGLLDLYNSENVVIFRYNDEFLFLYGTNTDKPKIEMLSEEMKYVDYEGGEYFSHNELYGKQNGERIFKQNRLGLNFISYSNIFINDRSTATKNIYPVSGNVSTNFLLNYSEITKKFPNSDYNQIEKLIQYDMLLMLELIKNRSEDIKDVITPSINYLIISCENIFDKKLEYSQRFMVLKPSIFGDETSLEDQSAELKSFIKNRKNLFQILNNQSERFEKEENGIKYFICTSLMNALYDIFMKIKISYKDKSEKENVIKFYKDFDVNQLLNNEYDIKLLENDEIKQIIVNILSLIEEKNIKIDGVDIYKEFINTLMILKPNLEDINDYGKVKFKIKEDTLKILQEFLELYWTISNDAYYGFFWSNGNDEHVRYLSSGEDSMLKMYARLYSAINPKYNRDTNEIDTEDKNFIILMDEPELYLHPEWQRNLIYNLINFFNKTYYKYNVQLIISSNTPFLLSDLPRENVITLTKEKVKNDDQDYYIKVSNENNQQTFGQNIHTLLKKSFFMNSTIGEFSKNKINNIIEKLNNGNEKINNIEEVKKTINMIGEPIIRNKLLEMLHTKLYKDNSLEKIEEEIKRLQLMKESILKKESDFK